MVRRKVAKMSNRIVGVRYQMIELLPANWQTADDLLNTINEMCIFHFFVFVFELERFRLFCFVELRFFVFLFCEALCEFRAVAEQTRLFIDA